MVHKLKRSFFVLLQTEDGDVFKLVMDYSQGTDGFGKVENMRIRYFETLFTSVSLCLLKSGFLFAASEYGNHLLYQIENLGDDEEEQPEFQSQDFDQKSAALTQQSCVMRARNLRNLSPVDEIQSLCPLIDSKVLNLQDEETPQIYVLCGRGSRSTFRILRHGLDVSEIAVSELPGNPSSVWTVRGAEDEFDRFIVISFINATLILRIGETVEEVTDTGFLVSKPTLAVGQLGSDDALVQVHPHGIRHIRPDRRVSEWRAPAGTTNMHATVNKHQVATCLSTGEIVYFELDPSGNLNEFQQHLQLSATAIRCVALAPISEGRVRSNFLAVGTDNAVQIISLDPSSCLEKVCMQALSCAPKSLCFVEMKDPTSGLTTLFLNIGLSNGVLLRTTLDITSGTLSDSRLLYLGAKPVKLIPVKVSGEQGIICISSRTWLGYTYQNRYRVIPLCYESLEHASSFASEQCSEGIVAIKDNTLRFFMSNKLRILNVDKLGTSLSEQSVKLAYTPRRFLYESTSKCFVIIESEHGVLPHSERQSIKQKDKKGDEQMNVSDSQDELNIEYFGLPRAPAGNWASCIRLLSPHSGETCDLIELERNEAAIR